MRKGFVIIISNKMNKLDCSFNHLGIVEAIGDGIGLTNVANGEKKQEEGLVLNLEKNKIVLSSDEKIKPGQFVIRTFQLMSLQSINTNASALIIGDSKTEIALGNWIQYVPKTWHILSKPLKNVMEVSTMNKNWNPNFDNLYISKLCTSKYFENVIPSQQLFERFYNKKNNLTEAEKSYGMKHFNQTYNNVYKVLNTHFGYSVPVGETKEHNLVLYAILENKKSWNAFNTKEPPSVLIEEGVPTRSGKSFLVRSVVIKIDKKYNLKDVLPTVTEIEVKNKGLGLGNNVKRTNVVDYILRSIKEEYPCLELDSYFYQMLLMSKVFEMFHQGMKVDDIDESMRKNKEELIFQNRELIKNMQIQDE